MPPSSYQFQSAGLISSYYVRSQLCSLHTFSYNQGRDNTPTHTVTKPCISTVCAATPHWTYTTVSEGRHHNIMRRLSKREFASCHNLYSVNDTNEQLSATEYSRKHFPLFKSNSAIYTWVEVATWDLGFSCTWATSVCPYPPCIQEQVIGLIRA